MNPYVQFVRDQARRLREGRSWRLGGFPKPPYVPPPPGAPRFLIFSPHPDDECIIGGLPLRLMRECGWSVANVAVTLGSNPARQADRLAELAAACEYLAFDLVTIGDKGLEHVTAKARAADPAAWSAKVDAIAGILLREKPRAILFPHVQDWNGTHIGVHHLVMDALATLGGGFETDLVESEFWGQNHTPNALVETSERDLVDLITALTSHVGEVQRNPYHLTLPAWMTNNVRLGGETVGGQGKAPPEFAFGTNYQVRRWQGGAVRGLYSGGRVISAGTDPSELFG